MDYFASCYRKHISPDSDLIISETAVNDFEQWVVLPSLQMGDWWLFQELNDHLCYVSDNLKSEERANEEDTKQVDTIDFTEVFARDVLSQSNEVALLFVDLFAPKFPFMSGADKHAAVSEYYVSS